MAKVTCCNCQKGYFGDPRGPEGTFDKCDCACHEHGGKYPSSIQNAWENRHKKDKPKGMPQWWKDEQAKNETKKVTKEDK
jgi:hypothetical protein